MLIYNQFGIIQNLQMSLIPKTNNWSVTFFAITYSKPALKSKSELSKNNASLRHLTLESF